VHTVRGAATCASTMSSAEFNELRERADQARITFLNIEIDLAYTLVQTAEIEKHADPKRSEQAIEKANAALLTVWELAPRILNIEARKTILERADELQKRISSARGGV
jgi:hypothetical protein